MHLKRAYVLLYFLMIMMSGKEVEWRGREVEEWKEGKSVHDERQGRKGKGD